MPIYEYACQKCEHITEALRPMSEVDRAMACESCGSSKTHRCQSEFAAGGSKSGSAPMPPTDGCGHCGDLNGPCGI